MIPSGGRSINGPQTNMQANHHTHILKTIQQQLKKQVLKVDKRKSLQPQKCCTEGLGRQMAQQLGGLVHLPEDSGSISNTSMAANSLL